jgi:GxxExxY protein
MKHQELSAEILNSFYKVYNILGYGFLEKVYENALYLELVKKGLSCKKQAPIRVLYQDSPVGDYYADIIVEDKIILELKAAEGLVEEHELQLVNYLKATNIEVGLLLNFGKSPQFKRKVFSNDRKLKNPRHPRHPRSIKSQPGEEINLISALIRIIRVIRVLLYNKCNKKYLTTV